MCLISNHPRSVAYELDDKQRAKLDLDELQSQAKEWTHGTTLVLFLATHSWGSAKSCPCFGVFQSLNL